MNRYWDLTEKQRSELTCDQVRAFLDVELMEKGVARVDDPTLHPIEPVQLDKRTYYTVNYRGEYSDTESGFCFDTAENAMAFIALHPCKIDNRWEWGNTHFARQCLEMVVKSVELPSEQSAMNAASILEKNKAAEAANAKTRSEYSKALDSIKKATAGVWEDWNECREKAAQWKKVADTRSDYVKLCDGNAELAETFLAKVFTPDEIAAALAWAMD